MNFRPVFVEGRDIDDTWYQLLQAVYEKGRIYTKTSGSRTGMKVYAFDFVSGFIHYPHNRPLAPRMPEGSTLPPPTNDEKIEKYFVDYLMNSHLSPKEHYKYSTWIVGSSEEHLRAGGNHTCPINQVEWLVDHFKVHGYGNTHCYIVVGNPISSLEYNKPYLECPACKILYPRNKENICPVCNEKLVINEALRPTTPCLRGLDFRIIEGVLTTNVIYRSWDMFAWPENMGGFTLLNEYIAEQLGDVEPGPLSFVSKSLHCPEDCIEILKMRLGK
ncbi:MAG: hypothetical protein ACMUJM_22295 [bacterium]